MDSLSRDLRFALRTYRKRPGFVAVAVVTLALGIGVNTTIFSAVNGILLRSLPGVVAPERLAEVLQGRPGDYVSVSYPIFAHLRKNNDVLEDLAAFDIATFAIGGEGAPEVVLGLQVTGNYFSVLGAEPELGRFFDPAESFFPQVVDAAVISHDLWVRRFNASPDVLGTTILLNGWPTPIIGVAPEGFGGHLAGVAVDVWAPVGMQAPQMHSASSLTQMRSGILELLGRLRDGVGLAGATANLDALADQLAKAEEGPEATYPIWARRYGVLPGSGRDAITMFFGVLMVVVALVLVIACVNVANMLLSRATERGREIAIRLSLGAGRGALVRQLVTETMLLFVVAAALGILLASWAVDLLAAFEPPLPLPGLRLDLHLRPDARVLGYALSVTFLTGLVFGLVPALRATSLELVPSLKHEQGPWRHGRSRLRGGLVAGQVAITVVLLVGSALFVRALRAATDLDPGFETGNVLAAGFDLELNDYSQVELGHFYDQLLERVRGLPGVEVASLAGKLPLAGASTTGVRIGAAPATDTVPANLHNQSVSQGYFRTLRIPLLEGREILETDSADAPGVVVINAAMSRRFWPDGGALGQRISITGFDGVSEREFEVVGVVADANYHSLVEETPNFGYFSHRQRSRTDMILHVRKHDGAAAGDASTFIAVREIVRDLDPGVPVLSLGSLDELLGIHFIPQRIGAWVTGVAGSFGLLLGAVGIYGVTAYAAGQRRREIGIRLALGARSADVLSLIVRQGMIAPLLGLAIGLTAAAGLTRFLASFLFGVSPLDWLSFAGVTLVLCGVALAAIVIPARRAALLDPVTTLRSE